MANGVLQRWIAAMIIFHRDPRKPHLLSQGVAKRDPKALELPGLGRFNPVICQDRVQERELALH